MASSLLPGELQDALRTLFSVLPTYTRHFWGQTDLKEGQGLSPELCLLHLGRVGRADGVAEEGA